MGLPRTGTQSFDDFMTRNGFNCAHIGYGENDHVSLEQFVSTGKGKVFDFMKRFDVFGDSPYYGLIDAIRKYFPKTKLIATHRNKQSWLKSMAKHPRAGGSFLRTWYGKNKTLDEIFDDHYKKCVDTDIPLLSLELPDNEKTRIIQTLGGIVLITQKYNKVDNAGHGLKISSNT